MKKFYLNLLILFLFGSISLSKAQDVHFSQYYTFAQALNPALTGNFDGSYRVALIYRNQWSSFLNKNAFMTPGAAIDLPLFEGQLKKDKLGLGLMFYNDRMGEASLVTNNVALSLAYHKGLGKEGKHRISLGGQVAYVQSSLDRESYVFYDQFDVFSHSGVGTSAEFDASDFDRGSYFYFDYNFGLYWKSQFSDKFRMQGGFSTFHMSQPNQWFIKENDDIYLHRRYQGDLGFEVFFTDKLALAPDVLYQKQGENQMILAGGSLGYYFNSGFRTNSSLHLGARYRVSPVNGDAVVVLTQVEFRNLRIGGAYDVNLSNLKTSSSLKGAFEISLVYVGESIRSYKANKSLPARRF
ncbi:MAG: PorP/SprF family type IX secretion system membrane protein [Bacteroidetes bacterium]|nr:PorP/SprF family type IX secretion system membrane protein [Bacteroidota bacterium]